jgi:hypothetical protein
MGHDGLNVTSIADARLHTVAFVLREVTFLTRSYDRPKIWKPYFKSRTCLLT